MSERKMGFSKRATLGIVALVVALGPITGSAPLAAAETTKSYDFAMDAWHAVDESDGPVTLHRIRLDRKDDRFTKSTLARPHNQEFLETVRIQLEYTNTASQKWRARVSAKWLDEDGQVIDGFSANETLDKKSARKVTQVSVSTLKYGLERAKTLEVEIHYEP